MKKCNKCLIKKIETDFNKDNRNMSGITGICKICFTILSRNNRKTKKGLINKILQGQKNNSIRRNHMPPTYKDSIFKEWLSNDWVFEMLYKNWANCGYLKEMIPSIDRLNDAKGYSFDNIQIMTWKENKQKSHNDMRSGVLINVSKPQRAVSQYSIKGEFIKEFVSGSEASRHTIGHQGNISSCCNGKRNTSGGYKWKYSKEKELL